MTETTANSNLYVTPELVGLDRRLVSLRTATSSKLRDELSSRLRQLLPILNDLQRLCTDMEKIVANPQYGTESELKRIQESRSILALVERELSRISDPTLKLVNDHSLLKLLELCEDELDHLSLLINQRSTIGHYYETWNGLVSEAREKGTANTQSLIRVSQTLISEVASVRNLEHLLPSPQHLNIKWSSKPAYEDFPFLAGIMVARLVAYCLPQFPRGEDYIELLTSAALLHDVGLIPLLNGHHQNIKQLSLSKTQQVKTHPSGGAIIAGRFKEMPVTFPYLIRQHHEKLNGHGYPDQMLEKSLPPSSRLLAIFCRLNDLLMGTGFMNSPPSEEQNKPMPLKTAGTQLKKEANLGELDGKLVAIILEILKLDNSNIVIPTSQSTKSLRRDSGHEDILAPNLGNPLVTSWSWQKNFSQEKSA